MQDYFKNYKKEIGLITGILLCVLCVFINPFACSYKANLVVSFALLMIIWWVFEAMPMPIVALIPVILFPLFEISTLKEVTRSYTDPIIFLFMGGFFIALAIEKWNLHKRMALGIITITGTNGNRIILGFIIATGFLSLWLSNTATTMMMFPIAVSVIHVIRAHNKVEKNVQNFSLALMLSIAYASNFALGTIIATPPNVAYVGYIYEELNYTIDFVNWMIMFIPLTIILLLMLYWVLVKWLYPNHIKHSVEATSSIKVAQKKLGKMSIAEKRVMMVFIGTVLLWIFKDILNGIQTYVVLDDTIIAVFGALLLFIVPSSANKDDRQECLMAWPDAQKMAWDILLLFGGGIALARALEATELIHLFGIRLATISTDNMLLLIIMITTISVFLSEVISNMALVILLSPVVTSLALAMHINPLLLGIPMTLGASCASMLPMGTPPNAIVFSQGHIKIKQMVKAGFVLNIICIFIISLTCWLLIPILSDMK
jgi:solute carrier family 13 (sodium-dependent dicarboxylate transporter), member 2/3/5